MSIFRNRKLAGTGRAVDVAHAGSARAGGAARSGVVQRSGVACARADRASADDVRYKRGTALRCALMVALSVVLVLGGTPAGAWVALAAGSDASASASGAGADGASGSSSATDGTGGGTSGGSAGGGTSGSGSGSTDGGTSGGSTDGGSSTQPETIQVSELVLQWSKDYGGTNQFVGDGWDIPSIEITEKGQVVLLNGWYFDNTGSGEMLQVADSSSQLGSFTLNWKSSDPTIASVDPSGLVTPKANGTVTITASVAKPEKYGAAETSIQITFDGQEGEYVSAVEILDANGDPLDDTLELVSNEDAVLRYQLYARVHWVNADGVETRVESTLDSNVSTTLRWETAGSNGVVAINEKTGLISTQKRGVSAVRVVVAGGVGGENITATVNLRVETAQDPAGVPASSLTLKVVYEQYPDYEVENGTRTFSPEELASLLPQYEYLYTIIAGRSNSGKSFATVKAKGYLFKDVLKLMNVDIDDIAQLRFITTDNYPEPVSHTYLFGNERYYWPNFDIGQTSEAQIVPPILATESYWTWNALADPNGVMSSEEQFQLVFGAKDTEDGNSSKQIKYIEGITIYLQGAPPSENPGSGGEGSGEGDGSGDGQGDGNGGQGNGGQGNGGSSGTVGPDAAGSGSEAGQAASGSSGSASSASTAASAATEASASSESAAQTSTSSSGSGGKWRIYQMMNKSNSDPGDLDIENPFAPFTAPAGCAIFAIGCMQSYASYRRRLFA